MGVQMKTIIRQRDSGKAKDLLQYASENNAIVVSGDKRAFKVKAESYGIDNVEIIDYNDLWEDNFDATRPLVIHNGDKMLKWMIDKFFNATVIGMSATVSK